MQTLDPRPIFEPEGWYFIGVTLTKAGRKKVQDAFEWHYRGGWAIDEDSRVLDDDFFSDKYCNEHAGCSWEDWADDIEGNATGGMYHPVYKFGDEIVEFVENVDYVIEMQSKEAFELALLAKRLNEMHEVFSAELDRIGA